MAEKGKDKKKEKVKPEKKSKKKWIFIILFLIAVIIAAGAVFMLYRSKDNYKPVNSPFYEIPQKTDRFFYDKSLPIHEGLKEADKELVYIENEIERIKTIEKEYPDQKNITQKKITYLLKVKESVNKEMSGIIQRLNDLYVQYHVNPETGEEFISQEGEKINKDLDKTIKALKAETEKFKSEEKEPQGLIGKVKSLLNFF